MALQDLLDLSNKSKKIGLSEERIEAIKPALRQYIAFWREYPDLFIDFMQTGGDETKEKKLNFFFYQRVFLRAAMRYKYVYMTFPRALVMAPRNFSLFEENFGQTSLIVGILSLI